MTVRPAEHGELDALARLAALTFPLACPPGSTAQDQQAFIDAVLSPQRFAEYLDGPVPRRAGRQATASSSATPCSSPGEPADEDVQAALHLRPTIELSKCYVHPDHHGAGIANALMTASLEVARERGAHGMWLGVNQQNARAQAFYVRSGFAVVGTKHFTVGTRVEDDYVLERPL